MKNNSNCDKNGGLTYIFFFQLTPHIDKQNKYVEKSKSCQNEHDLID